MLLSLTINLVFCTNPHAISALLLSLWYPCLQVRVGQAVLAFCFSCNMLSFSMITTSVEV